MSSSNSLKRKKEAINVRTTRINNLILGRSGATSKVSKSLIDALSREGLLDALCLLYNECDKEFLLKKDRNIYDFINKYRDVIKETQNLRVNINDFSVKSLIGKGYFGEVHLATEKSTNDIYAIKKMCKSMTTTGAFQVKEERDIMATNSSEWITSLQYAFQDHDNLYLVMEYLPGGDLISLMIRNGAFDEDLARFYLAEMTMALNALHQMGYVHRDIKPENILLDRFGHLKLADFGNAASLNKDGKVVSMSPVGTPDYIAPELLETLSTMSYSKSVHDVTCDFWSMGIIGYEFICEVTPFHDDNVHDTYSKILCYITDDKHLQQQQQQQQKNRKQQLSYPDGVIISQEFNSLLNGLITKKSKRLSYNQIIQHPYFQGVDWTSLRHQVPPIIPTLNSEDDTSNFEDVDKKGGIRTTFTKSTSSSITKNSFAIKGNDFSGQNLPFIGYSYVNHHNEQNDQTTAMKETTDFTSPTFTPSSSSSSPSSGKTSKQLKITEMQTTIDEQINEIKLLQQKLLSAERKSAQTESLEKILFEAKNELTGMKDKLKEKTIELAGSKTDIKTLKSSLKIEETMRLESDANISELLNQTYQKWEKAKKLSEQNYEKQIAEKKTEISCLTQKLQARENELINKVDESHHLQETVENYKDLLKSTKEQMCQNQMDFDKNKKEINEKYVAKINDLKLRIQQEKETKQKLYDELRMVRQNLDESICSTKTISQSKATADKNTEEIKNRLTKQIEEYEEIRESKRKSLRQIKDLEKLNQEHLKENKNLHEQLLDTQKELIIIQQEYQRQQQQQREQEQVQEQQPQQYRTSECGGSELFRSAQGSLESISSGVEEQLRNDLLTARENEQLQRSRADRLEEVVGRLEEAITKLPTNIAVDTAAKQLNDAKNSSILERKNEKLEDALISVREQAIVERQASRTAHLSLYKLEKQLEELTADKKLTTRRYELLEEKYQKLNNEKDELEHQRRDNTSTIQAKHERITELQSQIVELKIELKREHSLWQISETERMKEKSEIIEHISKCHILEEKLNDMRRTVQSLENRCDSLTVENKRLFMEKTEQQQELCQVEEHSNDIEVRFTNLQQNYQILKEACKLVELQLNEVEAMYKNEAKENSVSRQKNTQLWCDIRERDTLISELTIKLNESKSALIDGDTKLQQLQLEFDQLNERFKQQTMKMIEQQKEILSKTNDLFEAQETIEVLNVDVLNLQRINENFGRELNILKEENSKVLTELFLAKETINRFVMDGKEQRQQINELRTELEQLNGTLSEQKNYYLHRDIKSEATQAQYKKLISYLQKRVDDLSQKKKKTLADVIFGTSNSSSSSSALKKENIPPQNLLTAAAIEESSAYKKLQEDLRRERIRCSQLKEQLLNTKTDIHALKAATLSTPHDYRPMIEITQSAAPAAAATLPMPQKIQKENLQQNEIITFRNNQEQQNTHHHFELTSLNSIQDSPFTSCLVCQKQIMRTHFKCKECKVTIHRDCRKNLVQQFCVTDEYNNIQQQQQQQQQQRSSASSDDNEDTTSQSSSSGITTIKPNQFDDINNREYVGDLILRTKQFSTPSLEIHCVYLISDDIFLFGCTAGLYSYHQSTKQLVHITGITNVTYISANENLSKCVLIGDNGEHLYLCDLRHLNNRAHASSALKPKLDVLLLELPFANRVSNTERWHMAKISGTADPPTDSYIIACTSSRLVILRFDSLLNRFKPVCALDTAKPVSGVLFSTSCSAIVSSDKFFEIDLLTFQAEEFLDESDMSSIEARTVCHPVSVFQINSQEFLLCFKEFGIFVDNYGDRSRPDNLNWSNSPTGFQYREPLLFITYRNMIEVIRLNRSFTKEFQRKQQQQIDDTASNGGSSEIRTCMNLIEPKIIGDCGPFGVFVLSKTTIEKSDSGGDDNDDGGTELITVDGLKMLRAFLSNSPSLETLLSSVMSTANQIQASTSSETISTISMATTTNDM